MKKVISCKDWTLPEFDEAETIKYNMLKIAEWAVNYALSEIWANVDDGKVGIFFGEDAVPIQEVPLTAPSDEYFECKDFIDERYKGLMEWSDSIDEWYEPI